MSHFPLQFGKIAEVNRMVTCKCVSQNIGDPVRQVRCPAKFFPSPLPIGRNEKSLFVSVQQASAPEGDDSSSSCFTALGSDNDPLFFPIDIRMRIKSLHFSGADAAVKHEMEGESHGRVFFFVGRLF